MPIYTPEEEQFTPLEQHHVWFYNVMLAEYGEEGWAGVPVPPSLNWVDLIPARWQYDFEDAECNLAFEGTNGYAATVWEAFPADDEDVPWATFLVDDFGARLLQEYSVFEEGAPTAQVELVLRRAADELPDRLLSGEFDRDGVPLEIPDVFYTERH